MIPHTLVRAVGLAALGLAVGAGAAAAQCGPPEPQETSETRTITAQVVDQSCWLVHGLRGADHKKCAEVCAEAGVPLVLLGDDGQLYLPVSTAMPSDGFNERLVRHAEEKVTVTGRVARKSGTNSITVERIEAGS